MMRHDDGEDGYRTFMYVKGCDASSDMVRSDQRRAN